MPVTDPYQAIADESRRFILDLLAARGPLRAGEIVARLPHISQPAVSKHLRVLRRARLVRDVREGRERWYELNPEPLAVVAQWLARYETIWDQRLQTLKTLAEQAQAEQAQAEQAQAEQEHARHSRAGKEQSPDAA
jgi:DNA-binding transcriptional ArsR family regulator